MKILYITPYNITDSIAQSGTVVSIKEALITAGNTVEVIDNLKVNKFYYIYIKMIEKLTKKSRDILREPFVLKSFCKQINDRKSSVEYDAVFSSTSVLCAFFQDTKPIVYFTDATFGGMLDYYWDSNKWTRKGIYNGNYIEGLALRNCDKAIFASVWAVNTALTCHNAQKENCIAINRGANIHHSFSNENIETYISGRNVMNRLSYYKMLFVGRDWIRKGGHEAIEIVKKLNNAGYKCKLIIVGCMPELSRDNLQYVDYIGFLNKSIEKENKILHELFLTSDFYLQPSRKECQGIAYAEASAFGLPCIARNTGGVSGIVTSNNGLLFESDATIGDYVEKIIEYINNPQMYKNLCMSTFKFYSENLTWKSVGTRLTDVLEELVFRNTHQ